MQANLRFVSPVLLFVALGCAKEATPNPTATAEVKPSSAPALTPAPSASAAPAESAAPTARPQRRDRAGLAGMFYAAVGDLELPADKKASIDKLGEELEAARPMNPETHAELTAALTEGVKAGKVEMSKLEPTLVTMDKAAATRKEAEVKALEALHKELDATQRKALVDAIKKQQADREARFKDRDKPADDKDDKEKSAERSKRKVERLAKELGLDADQTKKLEPIIAKQGDERGGWKKGGPPEEMKKRVDALLTAFEKETFSAAKLDFGADSKRFRESTKKRVDYLNAVLGVIKPEQRDKLAATLETRPRGGFGRGPGGPGGRHGRGMGRPGGRGDDPGADGPGEDD